MPVTLVIDQKGTTIRRSASTKRRELYAAEIATDRDNQGRPFSDRDRGRRKQRSSTTNALTACLNKCIKRTVPGTVLWRALTAALLIQANNQKSRISLYMDIRLSQ